MNSLKMIGQARCVYGIGWRTLWGKPAAGFRGESGAHCRSSTFAEVIGSFRPHRTVAAVEVTTSFGR